MRALLIQKDVKHFPVLSNTASCLRALLIQKDVKLREQKQEEEESLRALLIQKDVKLWHIGCPYWNKFESFVNSERCKTMKHLVYHHNSLRALLIQKDVKLSVSQKIAIHRLRALLIQKDVKLFNLIRRIG